MNRLRALTLSFLLAFAAASTAALAQNPAATVQTDQTYTLTVTGAEVQAIGLGLQELPNKFAAPLINKLSGQIAEQEAKRKADAEAAAPKKDSGPTSPGDPVSPKK